MKTATQYKLAINIILLLAVSFFISACGPGSGTTPATDIPASPETALPSVTDEVETATPVPTNTPLAPTPTLEPTAVETEHPTPEAPSLGSTRLSEIDKMEQIYVPAGEFIMGSDDIVSIRTTVGGRAYPEVPVNTVYLDGYWIDKFEVTNTQYELCVSEGGCEPPFFEGTRKRSYYYGNPEFADYPVVWVKWRMAREYCEWAGRRLPTEAEWEKAARGPDGRTYPWGEEPVSAERANFCDTNCPVLDLANHGFNDGYSETAPVGSFPAGASYYGVMDMAGNVWEWTGTLIEPYPYDSNDGREDPDAPGERSWRGAAWNNGYWWLRASVRYRSVANYWYDNLGFRCAASE